MGPFGRTTTSSRTKARRKPRRSRVKKHHPQSKNQEISSSFPAASCSSTSFSDSLKMKDIDFEVIEVSTSACCTPKAPRFRIPQISACPPAPKKARVLSNCSLHRSPVAFFAPPDLELFFFAAS